MKRKGALNGVREDCSPLDALAMLVEYALMESRELRLPLVTFLLKMARSAIQSEALSDPPLTMSPDGLEEAKICPLWPGPSLSVD